MEVPPTRYVWLTLHEYVRWNELTQLQTALPTPVTGLHGRPSPDDQKQVVDSPPFGGDAQQLVIQLATAIYIVEVINNGGPLQEVCDTLNVTVLYFEGLNGALAKQKICAAAANPPPPANASAINGIITLATALYAVEVAGNYAGGTNLTNLCNLIDYQAIDLLGFDGPSVEDFVCSAAATEITTPSCASPTAPVSPINTSASSRLFGTAPAIPVGATASPHSTITVHSTVTLHSVITLRPSGTAPANGINTSSGSFTVVATGPRVTPGPVTVPTVAPQPNSGSGTNNTTSSTKLLHQYSVKPEGRSLLSVVGMGEGSTVEGGRL